jgi:cyclopropane fatty-acyl-phospholipid synthase-like methyltransferase
LFQRKIKLLDIGCAGGHSVWQFNQQGHAACGIDGSDYRKIRNMPEWNIEPNLFTCDATKPFQIYQDGVPACFDVITAWEFMEHIHVTDLPQLYQNVLTHLTSDGIFLGSICVFDQARCDRTKGVEWGPKDEYPDKNFHHQNMWPREIWWKHLEERFDIRWDLVDFFGKHVVRGPGVHCGEDCTVNFYLQRKNNA